MQKMQNKHYKHYHEKIKPNSGKMDKRRQLVREAKRRLDVTRKKTPEEISAIRSSVGVLGAAKRWGNMANLDSRPKETLESSINKIYNS